VDESTNTNGADGASSTSSEPLTDEQLRAQHPALADLVIELEAIGEVAPYSADPRAEVRRISRAMATYFRTPD
jgi:hypothetical protein